MKLIRNTIAIPINRKYTSNILAMSISLGLDEDLQSWPIALVVIAGITPFALSWKIWVSIAREERQARDIMRGTAAYFFAIASSLDKLGNCAFGGLLNDLLLIEGKYKFGATHETVSIVLGWAHRRNDLNKLGRLLRAFVNWIDFSTPDHCRDAMLISIQRSEQTIFENRNPL